MNPTSNSPTAGNSDDSYGVGDLFGLLVRRKRTVALVTLVMALLGAWFTFTSAPQYEVKAKISYTDRYRLINPAGEWSGLEDESPASAEIDILNSHPTLAQLIGEVHVDGTLTGLGLRQQLHDVANYWPWPRMKRKLFGGGPAKGSVRVWADGPLPLGGVEIEFLSDGGVEIAQRSLFGSSKKYDSFGADQPLDFLGRQVFIDGDGTQPGRLYIFHSNNLYDTLEGLRARLKVNETLKNSGVLELRYTDTDPDRAAVVLNQLLVEYIKLDQKRLAEPATHSREFLEREKASLEAAIIEAGQRLSAFHTQHEGSVALEEKSLALTRHLVVLELDLEQKEFQVKSLNGLLDQVSGDKLPVEAALKQASDWNVQWGTETGIHRTQNSTDDVTTNLLGRLSALQEERAAKALEHSKEWTGFAELDARIEYLRSEMLAKLDADLRAAVTDAAAVGKMVKAGRERLVEKPKLQGRLAGMEHHLTALSEQLLLLMGRLEKATIAEKAALATPTMKIIDPATAPLKAKFPRPVLTLALSIVLGLAASIILAVMQEAFRKPLLSSSQLQAVTQVPSLGTLPQRNSKTANDDNGSWQEAVRSLRFNMQSPGQPDAPQTVALVSAGLGEGSSTAITDLAMAMAKVDLRVLLIDADLRHPSQAKRLGVSASNGFADSAADAWQQAAQSTSQSNLWLLGCGKLNGHAGEAAAQIPWAEGLSGFKQHYDLVLIDAPAFLSVSDSIRPLQQADAVIMVNRYDHLSSRLVQMAADRMRALDINLTGCVLNGYRAFGVRGYVDGYAFDRMAKRTAGGAG